MAHIVGGGVPDAIAPQHHGVGHAIPFGHLEGQGGGVPFVDDDDPQIIRGGILVAEHPHGGSGAGGGEGVVQHVLVQDAVGQHGPGEPLGVPGQIPGVQVKPAESVVHAVVGDGGLAGPVGGPGEDLVVLFPVDHVQQRVEQRHAAAQIPHMPGGPVVLNGGPADVALAQNGLFALNGGAGGQDVVPVLVKILVPAIEGVPMVVVGVERTAGGFYQGVVPAVPENVLRGALQHQPEIWIGLFHDPLELRVQPAQIPGVVNAVRPVVPDLVAHVKVAQFDSLIGNVLRHRGGQVLDLFQAGLAAEGVQRFQRDHHKGHDRLALAEVDKLPQAEGAGGVVGVEPAPVAGGGEGLLGLPVEGPGVVAPAHHTEGTGREGLFHPVAVGSPHLVAGDGHLDVDPDPAGTAQRTGAGAVHRDGDLRGTQRLNGRGEGKNGCGEQGGQQSAEDSAWFHRLSFARR